MYWITRWSKTFLVKPLLLLKTFFLSCSLMKVVQHTNILRYQPDILYYKSWSVSQTHCINRTQTKQYFMKFLGVKGHLVMPMQISLNLIMQLLCWEGLWGELNVAFYLNTIVFGRVSKSGQYYGVRPSVVTFTKANSGHINTTWNFIITR